MLKQVLLQYNEKPNIYKVSEQMDEAKARTNTQKKKKTNKNISSITHANGCAGRENSATRSSSILCEKFESVLS
jgi:hypothetical protein